MEDIAMQTIFRGALRPWLVISGVILAAGCGSSVPTLEPFKPESFSRRVDSVRCTVDPSWSASLIHYQTTGDAILDARVDSSGQSLAIVYGNIATPKQWSLVVVSLDNSRPGQAFRIPAGSRVTSLTPQSATVQEPGKLVYVDLRSPKQFREIQGFAMALNKHELRFFQDTVSLWEMDRPEVVWQQYCPDCLPYYNQHWSTDDYIFWLKDGLWCARYSDGRNWHFKASIASKNYAAAVTRGIFGAFASALTGVTISANADPDVTMGLFSNPYVAGDRVVFASEENISALSLSTGDALWQKPIQGRSGLAVIAPYDSSSGIFVELGKDFYNGKERLTENAYVCRFDYATGEEAWRFPAPSNLPVTTVSGWTGLCVQLIGDTLYAIAKNGDIVLQEGFGADFAPLRILTKDTLLFVIGEKGVVAWRRNSAGKLEQTWRTRIGPVRVLLGAAANRLWLLNGGGILEGVNVLTGRVDRSVDLVCESLVNSWQYDETGGRINLLLLRDKSALEVIRVESLIGGLKK